ncbi:response regulator [Cyanobium sp. LEGE 06113]|uniref:response regulator n=1 Tax=Cyanobium sp. LEGE 06113 TaxID=1297573 RepID=UPI001D14DBB8|nr:response regulator [Cyanobium sp. LEGE 06113]
MRILLIEDDSGISRFIQQGLSEAGYAIDVASDGPEGVRFAEAADYDAVVLDVLLPGQDGLSVLKILRQRGLQTPVLLLTALDTVEDRVLGLDAGADDYLTKPFDFTELLARCGPC